MKKTYITPNIKAHKFQTTSILAGSENVNYGGGDGNTGGGTVEGGAKDGSYWDEY